MKNLTFALAFILILGNLGCVPAEEELITETCTGFNFSIPARDWILLLPGPEYVFRSGEKRLKVNSKYEISEPYTIESTPQSLEKEIEMRCFGEYRSDHRTEAGSLRAYNYVVHGNGLDWSKIVIGIQDLNFDLFLVNDTLTAKRLYSTLENPDNHLFENIPSLKIGEKQFTNIFKITQLDTNTQLKEIYLAKRQGLVAFTMKDSLWVVEWEK